MFKQHLPYMMRCLKLASQGAGWVAPNPMVGAVLVKDGQIIGEGFHREFGKPHAEVNAIQSVSEENRHQIEGATLYVSLEPCNHFGKTPPCSHLIVDSKISEVVYGIRDPFPKVNGSGLAYLEAHGIQVTGPVLEKEAAFLNRRFFCFQRLNRPYVILKWAESADGFMAPPDRERIPISSPDSARITHRWRAEEMAILVGAATVHFDNPVLDVRAWEGKNPLRVVWDEHNRLGTGYKLFTDGNPTLKLSRKELGLNEHQGYTSGEIVTSISEYLYQKQIQSVLVEGGKKTLDLFLSSGIWDEIRVIRSNRILTNGIESPRLHLAPDETFSFSGDHYSIYYSNQHK